MELIPGNLRRAEYVGGVVPRVGVAPVGGGALRSRPLPFLPLLLLPPGPTVSICLSFACFGPSPIQDSPQGMAGMAGPMGNILVGRWGSRLLAVGVDSFHTTGPIRLLPLLPSLPPFFFFTILLV